MNCDSVSSFNGVYLLKITPKPLAWFELNIEVMTAKTKERKAFNDFNRKEIEKLLREKVKENRNLIQQLRKANYMLRMMRQENDRLRIYLKEENHEQPRETTARKV